MKRVLILGAHSYIGTALEKRLLASPDAFSVKTLSLHTPLESLDFRGADAAVLVAAIVHRKETKETLPLYRAINCDLAVAAAKKAKAEGVGQFILMSSENVYGMNEGVITKDTVLHPVTAYGRSKLEAERAIAALCDDTFTVTILRSPMVIGKGAKGNYRRLEALAKRLPFSPDFENRRSLVRIETLCDAIERQLETPRAGIFFPQEPQPVATRDLIEQIARERGRTLRRTKLFNPAIRVLIATTTIGKKAFGNLEYRDLAALPLSVLEERA